MDRPALVDLAGAAQSERDVQAGLVYATEDQWRARTDPTITPEDVAAAGQRVHTTEEVLQEAKEHLRASEAGNRPTNNGRPVPGQPGRTPKPLAKNSYGETHW